MALFPSPPEFWSEGRSPEMWRLLSLSIRGLLRGQSNNVQTVTLEANATQTEVLFGTCTAVTVVTISPQTANAAASLALIYMVTTLGKVTIFHDSSGLADRTFGVVFTG